MSERMLLCTDMDRTLLPNGPQPESPRAREIFRRLTDREEVILAYVTGRHRKLVENAIRLYQLTTPDYVVSDVGTRLWALEDNQWHLQQDWENEISADWGDYSHDHLIEMFRDLRSLRLQEPSKQNTYKLSYYLPLQTRREPLLQEMNQRLSDRGIRASLIWSIDEPAGIGLLDVLPAGATKLHAIRFLARRLGVAQDEIIFAGDSGNDLPVFSSGIASVLVANATRETRQLTEDAARAAGVSDRLYLAQGDFMGLNGNYTAGIVEGVVHYKPASADWLED
jgi:hypothetical protein